MARIVASQQDISNQDVKSNNVKSRLFWVLQFVFKELYKEVSNPENY